jgi:hypothetical protein
MNAGDALVKALQVLEEERVRQTLNYSFVSKTWPRALYWQQQQLQSQGYPKPTSNRFNHKSISGT